jgi:hypothetical protein
VFDAEHMEHEADLALHGWRYVGPAEGPPEAPPRLRLVKS